jgi:hypothetical protein
METQAKRFLTTWAIAVVTLVLGMMAFNYTMDPYLLFGSPRIAGFNARKPAADTQQRLMKSYEVVRARPHTLILGSSRVDVGIDPEDPDWRQTDRPVYNLGILSGSPHIAFRYLQHVAAANSVGLVVLGLEFQYSLPTVDPDPTFESRLAVTPNGARNPEQFRERYRDLFRGIFSLDAVMDSASTLIGNLSHDSSDLLNGNYDCDQFRPFLYGRGPYPFFAWLDLANFRGYAGKKSDLKMLADVQAILELDRARGIKTVVILNPSHVDEQELLDLLGYWENLEEWKRQLVKLVSQYQGASGDRRAEIWDFYDYNPYSTEPIEKGNAHPQWFFNPDHYRKALGQLIVRRIHGENVDQFGERLTPENVESHLASIREQRSQYRLSHQGELQRVHDIYRYGYTLPSFSRGD